MNRPLLIALETVQDTRKRRIGYLILAVILAILCVFPRPYVARAKMLPQDTGSAGLGQILNSLGGQFLNFTGILTNGRPPNDLYLIIGRSAATTLDVIRDLNLAGPGRDYATVRDAELALDRKVDVHLLVGGVLEVESKTYDPGQSERLTSAYMKAISARIGELGRETTRRKTQIVKDRFRNASDDVIRSERILDAFRSQYKLASPEIQLGSQLSLRAGLEGRLQAKLVEQQTLEQFAGPENPQLKNVQAEIASIRSQIGVAGSPQVGAAGPNIGALSELSTRYLDLYRNEKFAQSLYEIYSRALEQTEVEALVADSATYIQVIEPTNLDAKRAINVWAAASLVAMILIAVFTEIYVPATGLRWPDLRDRSEVDV